MNLKLLVTVLFVLAATYAVAMGVLFYLAGNPFTIEGFATYILDKTLGTVTTITSYIQDKLQLVVGGVGAAITAIATTYRLMQNRVTATKQQAESQIDTVQSNATQQYVTMQNTISSQQGTIGTLESKLSTAQAQADQSATLAEQYQQLQDSMRQVQAERDYAVAEWQKAMVKVESLTPKPIA